MINSDFNKLLKHLHFSKLIVRVDVTFINLILYSKFLIQESVTENLMFGSGVSPCPQQRLQNLGRPQASWVTRDAYPSPCFDENLIIIGHLKSKIRLLSVKTCRFLTKKIKIIIPGRQPGQAESLGWSSSRWRILQAQTRRGTF